MSAFTDQVVVVTGAGRGIGEAIAQAFAARGAKVAVLSRTEANSQSTAAALNTAHGEGTARAYAVDVADFEATQVVGKQVASDFGRIDILINNAGVTRDGLCLRMSESDWDTVLDTNLKGAFNTIKAFQRLLLKSPSPRVINIGSVIGLMGNAGQVNYAASKAGLIGLTKSLAREYASRSLTANVIAPGFISTDMTDALSEDIVTGILSKIPLGFLGKPEDIAETALFLAGPGARYITGQVITVDGGMVM